MLVKLEPQTRTVKLRYEWDEVTMFPRIISLAGVALSFLIPLIETHRKFFRNYENYGSKEDVK
ncbi:hypothetical protein CW705_10015 [Candidatus Bathyarchaeota archaeon]|nr:MAG: hypothetical protein CW705_10015 [Candidatus Bathyarchaeota archaeon]